ncbi:MAG: sigma-70 family RNA polymerase sigma factor [Acidimicrobiia bacterium]
MIPPGAGPETGRTFVDVYRGRYRSLVEIARLTTGSNALAEELVQDAFADLCRRFGALRSPDAYLSRAVMSRCTSWVRRRATERRYAERLPPQPPAWTDPDTISVMDAVGRLPLRQRAAIVLRYFADWSEADIAYALGCRPGTVKSLLSRARAQLAGELTDDH